MSHVTHMNVRHTYEGLDYVEATFIILSASETRGSMTQKTIIYTTVKTPLSTAPAIT